MKSGDLDLDRAVIVALGSNLTGGFDSCEALLEAALARFPAAGLRVTAKSRWWRSAAWPEGAGPEYRNGIAIVEAQGGPRQVLASLLDVEAELGRVRGERNAARTLDLDLIAHGRTVMDEEGLTLPHPRAHERRFVMGPLAEVAPGWVHPVLGETAQALAARAGVGADAEPA